MPIPRPNPGETQEKYVSRVVPMLIEEGNQQDQAVAIAISEYNRGTEAEKKPKSKIEILSDIKKSLEKNGFSVQDEKLLELFHEMTSIQATKFAFSLKTGENDTHEIIVFPRKKLFIEKEKKWFDMNSTFFQSMIESFKCPDLFPPFMDEQHQLGVKFADIVDLYEKPEGLCAKIKLNAAGIDAVKNNKYSFVSPEWGSRTDTKGINHKNVLWAVTLTNIPAMESSVRPLQTQIKFSKNIGGNKMDYRMKLAKFEGQLAVDGGDPMAIITELLTTMKDIVAKLEEVTGQKEAAEGMAEAAQAELSKIKDKQKEDEKNSFFESLVTKGQVEMKEIEDWKTQFDKSPDFVRKILSQRPEKSSFGAKSTTTKSFDTGTITPEDEQIMRYSGYVHSDGSLDTHRYQKEVLANLPKTK